MTAAVFLDRDNTIIHNDGDLGDPAQVRLIQGAASAIASLKGLGYRIIVVTNQGGVARGKYTEADVDRVNERINDLMKANSGVFVDRFYYCPYHPEGTIDRYRRDHPWRKPRPGMLLQAARDLGLDLRQSWMIGDQMRDVQAGFSAGAVPILLSVEGATPLPTAALPPAGTGDDRGGPAGNGASRTVLIEPARDYFVVRSLIEAVRLVGQKSRPTNVTAAMKTERIEVIPRPQPRVATASFDASDVPVAGQEPMEAAAPVAATIEQVRPVSFADLAQPSAHHAADEVAAEAPLPRRKRADKPKPAEHSADAPGPAAADTALGDAKRSGARLVTPIEAKAEPISPSRPEAKVEPKLETKVESKLRPQVEEKATPGGVPVAERSVPRDAAPVIEPQRPESSAMPTVAWLPTAEMKPARVPPSKRREEDPLEPGARAAPVTADEGLRSTEGADPAAAQVKPSAKASAMTPSSSDSSAPASAATPASPAAEQTLRQILQELRSQRKVTGDFSYITIMAIVLQMVAVVCLMAALLMGAGSNDIFMRWIACAIILQLATLSMLMFRK
jgi:D-glycero-D-manno-heptose 1,7-bisphosphate phosphatase